MVAKEGVLPDIPAFVFGEDCRGRNDINVRHGVRQAAAKIDEAEDEFLGGLLDGGVT
jgi:hypothetical protein